MSDAECRRILDVSAGATAETIRQSYLDLVRVWHPDRFQSNERLRKVAQEHLRKVNEAYSVLKSNRRRESRQNPPGPQSAQPSAHARSTAGKGSASATEEPPPARPDSGPPPEWTASYPPPRPVRHTGSFGRVLWSISNKPAYAAMVAVLLAVPFMAVSRLASLLRVPSLDNNPNSPLTFQPKILSPMRIIDARSDVLGAADALTNWARGDAVDLWKPVRYSGPDSPAAVARAGDDVRKSPVAAPTHGNRKRPTANTARQPAPLNGAELLAAGRQSGAGELHLSNHTGLEAVFKLASERVMRRAVYLAPGGSVTLRSIPVGVYFLYVDLGKDLDVEHLQFLSDRVTPTPLGPFQFLHITTETGTSGNHYDVVVNPQ